MESIPDIQSERKTMTMEQQTAQKIIENWIQDVMLVADSDNCVSHSRKIERPDSFMLTKPA